MTPVITQQGPEVHGHHDAITLVCGTKSYTYYGVPSKILRYCNMMIAKGCGRVLFNCLKPYRIKASVRDTAITVTDVLDRSTLEEIRDNLATKGEHQVAINGKVYIVTTLEHLEGLS